MPQTFPAATPRAGKAVLLALAGLLSIASLHGQAGVAAPAGRLLFHLSGDHGLEADIAAPGTANPTYASDVSLISGGARGGAIHCGDLQKFAYRAPGNIYSQRGTLSFFWRSVTPVGPTEFPIFRVAFADHSSWDMAWLRIDYNGHGLDAFVTDSSLARVRLSCALPEFPAPEQWMHIALSWDETGELALYVDGRLAARTPCHALLDTGLDQFGPHSRIISPHQVQSDYNFVRGGDIDELRIHDRALDSAAISRLAKGEEPSGSAARPGDTGPSRPLSNPLWREEWNWRHGWNRKGDAPPYLSSAGTSVRKVEIQDAWDLKRWYWKAVDGIRETTWPGVYNRSRLAGRNDYFQLPDWDCYSVSGKVARFDMPSEPWNHLELSGAAYGRIEVVDTVVPGSDAEPAGVADLLAVVPQGRERSWFRLERPVTGRTLRFTNDLQETPIAELVAYQVSEGRAPRGSASLSYSLTRFPSGAPATGLSDIAAFVRGRHPADEATLLLAVPSAEGQGTVYPALQAPVEAAVAGSSLPVVHVLVPDTWDKLSDGLDGLELALPAMALTPDAQGLCAMNVRVLDPLWPMRALLDFSFSVKPGEARTLWLDTRDRLLPSGRPLCVVLSSASADFGPASLAGTGMRLVFKPGEQAKAEHQADRFNQVKDCYAMLVEEHPKGPYLNMWVRFENDLKDLMRVSPEFELGRRYFAASGVEGPAPTFTLPPLSRPEPAWARRQVQLLEKCGAFADFWIDKRQLANGEFGGGISDDVDLTQQWPGLALMGYKPERLTDSVSRLLEASFENGMWTNGLSTIQTDELHSYEEGINALAECLVLRPGSPRLLERAFETARGIERVTGINAAGHRHFRSSYYSGTKLATEGVWGWSKAYSHLVLQPDMLVADFNGNPRIQKLLTEIADGLLAHRTEDPASGRAIIPSAIHFESDRTGRATRGYLTFALFWQVWTATGDQRYLQPVRDYMPFSLQSINANALDQISLRSSWDSRGLSSERMPDTMAGRRRPEQRGLNQFDRHIRWQLTGDKTQLVNLYEDALRQVDTTEYINTEGSLWSDRVSVPTGELQRERLGGTGLMRNAILPGHTVSWSFLAPASALSVGILIPDAKRESFTLIVHNLEKFKVGAKLTGADVLPGEWSIQGGVDTDGDDKADLLETNTVRTWGRDSVFPLEFAPGKTTVFRFELRNPGRPYHERPDLGIDPEDIQRQGDTLWVKVHSLGSVASKESLVRLLGADLKELARATVPALEPPLDLQPRTVRVALKLPARADLRKASVLVTGPEGQDELCERNNQVLLP